MTFHLDLRKAITHFPSTSQVLSAITALHQGFRHPPQPQPRPVQLKHHHAVLLHALFFHGITREQLITEKVRFWAWVVAAHVLISCALPSLPCCVRFRLSRFIWIKVFASLLVAQAWWVYQLKLERSRLATPGRVWIDPHFGLVLFRFKTSLFDQVRLNRFPKHMTGTLMYVQSCLHNKVSSMFMYLTCVVHVRRMTCIFKQLCWWLNLG